MRYSTDYAVRVARGEDGVYSSKVAEWKEAWSYPHFPEVNIFEVQHPSGRTFWFGVAVYTDLDIPRKLKMTGGYSAVIPGIENIGMVDVGPDGSQGFCVTLEKSPGLEGMAWEIMMRPADPWGDGVRDSVKKFEEWKTGWRKTLQEVEEELSNIDTYWKSYQRKKGAKDAEGSGD